MIDIEEPDAISDDGQQVFNLLEPARHRPRADRRRAPEYVRPGTFVRHSPDDHLGKQVVLVRDLTDTMYNSTMKPFVDHFSGTDLVVEHVERHWCPTITSVDLLGTVPFRFREDTRK